MKKITLKIFMIMCLLGTYVGVSQTLNQAASWPNAGWTLSGTYTAGGLFGDPSAASATFGFDDDAAGNGSADDIQATSPVIDLTAANGAGETWVTISGDFVYRALGGDVLNIEIYDADAMTWSAAHTFAGNSTNTDFQTCAGTAAYTTATINIAGYTPTQLSGFQYRFTYNDQGGWQWGWCLTSPTIVSATPPSCPDPSALTATNIDGFSADLGWTEAGSAMLWNVELVDITGGGAVTGTATATGVANPYMATGLTPSNNYEFYVQADCGGGTSAWVGPFAFATTVACPDPSALTATNVLTTTADLGWTAGGSEALWDVEIVDVTGGGVVTGTATATGVANPYMATGLTDNNNYSFYVRADCTPNGTSTWVGPFAFTTACNAFTAPYTQDFENGGAVPACWTLGGDENWLFNTAGPNHVGNAGTLSGSTTSGNYYAVVDDSDPTATDAQLNSPFVDVSGLTTPSLTFFEISNNEGQLSATLTVSVWDGAAWNVVGTYSGNTTAGWEQRVIDLSGLTFTGPAQVRFSVADSGSFYDDIAIDDVVFDELPACIAPSAASATNIMETSADIGWTENNGSMAWEIVVQAAGTGAPAGAGTATATNPYAATMLTESTDYEAYIRTDCGGGTFSAWTGPINFTTLTPPPANNDCSGAIALTPGGIFATNSVVGTNAGATDSGELPAPGCASFLGGDVWYSAVVPADGGLTLEVNTETGGITDTGGAVYSGTCGALVLVACNDDTSTNGAHPIININDLALANQTVYFRVWEFGNNATGEFQVSAYAASLSVESAEVRGFKHYVNTVNNSFVVNAQSNINSIEIYNLVGQIITTTRPNSTSGEANLGSVKNGVYFARVTLENGRTSVVKFVM